MSKKLYHPTLNGSGDPPPVADCPFEMSGFCGDNMAGAALFNFGDNANLSDFMGVGIGKRYFKQEGAKGLNNLFLMITFPVGFKLHEIY